VDLGSLVGVRARVALQPARDVHDIAKKVLDAPSPRWQPDPKTLEDALFRDELRLRVTLGVEDTKGGCIWSARDLKISGGKKGLNGVWWRYHGPPLPSGYEEGVRVIEENYHVGIADITDSINQMLGRDPDLHKPPILASGGLISALSDAGVRVTEDDLITLPLNVELDSAVQAELDLE